MINAQFATREVETDQSVVELELQRLLKEKRFSGAPQMSAFLRYIVTQTLLGHGNRIKAYTVGVDALGKPDTFDAQNDPSVRVLALRLRKTLNAVYEGDYAKYAIIMLKPGTYMPEFFKADSAESIVIEPASRCSPRSQGQATASEKSFRRVADVDGSRDQANDKTSSEISVTSSSENPPAPVSADASDASGLEPNRLKFPIVFAVLACAILVGLGSNMNFDSRIDPSAGISVHLAGLSAPFQGEPEVVARLNLPPTLYLVSQEHQSEQLDEVVMLFGSSVVKAGNLKVVQTAAQGAAKVHSRSAYNVVFNELRVDSRARIDAQIVQSQSGAVVASATLLLSNDDSGFSGEEVTRIEQFASGIADKEGPVFKHFCESVNPLAMDSCQLAADTVENDAV